MHLDQCLNSLPECIIIIIIITLFMCLIDLAPCKDRVLIGDTLIIIILQIVKKCTYV